MEAKNAENWTVHSQEICSSLQNNAIMQLIHQPANWTPERSIAQEKS